MEGIRSIVSMVDRGFALPTAGDGSLDGGAVVALGHLEGKAKATGEKVKVPFAHVWRFEGGQ